MAEQDLEAIAIVDEDVGAALADASAVSLHTEKPRVRLLVAGVVVLAVARAVVGIDDSRIRRQADASGAALAIARRVDLTSVTG